MTRYALSGIFTIVLLAGFSLPSPVLAQTEGELFARAKAAVDSGRASKAVEILSELISRDPKADYFHYRGIAKTFLGEDKSALKDLNIAISKNPLSVDFLMTRAKILINNGLYRDGIKDLSKVLSAEPRNPDALFLRAKAYLNTFQEDKSYSDINGAIGIDPSNYQYYLIRADLLSSTGNYRDSLSDYDKVISLNPSCSQAYNNRGVALARLGRTKEAIDDLRRSMETALSTPSPTPLPGFSVNAW